MAKARTRETLRIGAVLTLFTVTAVLISGISFNIAATSLPTPADFGTAVAPTTEPPALDG
ncbi:hypothetical protein [Herbiconiux sp. VKM Ac-2851]|uniref:hypothetical protein n=1 Tax=Herbiconiux sp. VKM Ac-2851 TaxID=2739025 RepID=UPI001565FC4C|nr:hypothetical protein [Herbiconiux sp. VKM Ac-2851]NQX37054.1 hypothetical protein [Herbiconiux sp. VKM Ac-2851]